MTYEKSLSTTNQMDRGANQHKLLLFFSIIYFIDIRLECKYKSPVLRVDCNTTHMLQRHENSDLLHNLSDLKFSLNPYTLTSNLPVTSGVDCEVDRCERSCSEALRSYNIVAD